MKDNIRAKSRVNKVKHETCKKGYLVKVRKFEILFKVQEDGNIVKILSVIEDLSREHKILNISPVKVSFRVEVRSY